MLEDKIKSVLFEMYEHKDFLEKICYSDDTIQKVYLNRIKMLSKYIRLIEEALYSGEE